MERPAQDRDGGGAGAAWVGFLAAAFCIVGMMGLFVTYAAPLAYQRALHREAVLDTLLATPPPHRPALRQLLDDSADAVLSGPEATFAPRVAAERVAMRARFEADAEATAGRLRLLIVTVTLAAALFGAAVMGLQRRR